MNLPRSATFVAGILLGSLAIGIGIRALPIPLPALPLILPAPERAGADPIQITAPTAELLDAAWNTKEEWKTERGTRVLLVPHHLVAAREMASLFAATKKPSVVYLVSPDHFSGGKTVLTTTDAPFLFGDTTIRSRPSLVDRLVDVIPELRINRDPIVREHGITGLVPFFQRAWGDVPVVPIMVRIDASQDVRTRLGITLAEALRKDRNALLVMTVDFSHDLPIAPADFHDVMAQDVIQSLADLETNRVELDSPGALSAGLKAARELRLGNVTIHAHTNSLKLMRAVIAQDSTSHFLASFAPGDIQDQQATTLLFLGDTMLDRDVRTRRAQSQEPLYPFHAIRDNENRFFRGQDAVIANLEGPVTASRRPPEKTIDFAFDPSVAVLLRDIGITAVSQANNHQLDQGRTGADDSRRLLQEQGVSVFGDQVRDDAESATWTLNSRGKKIAVLGFNTTDNPLDRDEAQKAITSARASADRVVVFLHWGEEYKSKPSPSQIDLAHWLIDQDVDAVIGAHPHWVQSIETYRGRPIAYSLGNFVFDQDWSAETRQGLVAGLAFLPDRTELHLFPIQIDLSVPRLLTGDERQKRLDGLAGISDPSLSAMIKTGTLITNPTP